MGFHKGNYKVIMFDKSKDKKWIETRVGWIDETNTWGLAWSICGNFWCCTDLASGRLVTTGKTRKEAFELLSNPITQRKIELTKGTNEYQEAIKEFKELCESAS